ncbi:MBOAT family O-acyltransferase [Catalinimonas sp. 4WD22]|uniref:MBOAT family O-acyltransferase n=1 Tax=Catalinimonas locisalis TaxID=3133978 RepID=UPI00310154E8
MLFNSLEFILFFIICFFFYWFIFKNSIKKQNVMLLIASYFFYGWWDWRFLSLIAFSSLVDYTMGIFIYKSVQKKRKKLFLWISLLSNLGLLGFFKYYNFFIDSLLNAFATIGYTNASVYTLYIILPVGISFYTFQTLSYTIDIYRGNLKPSEDLINFLTFVSFFPQLVAGPIERAANLLPQFDEKRTFSYEDGQAGLRMILWGLFKKIAIADYLGTFVVEIFDNHPELSGSELFIGLAFFAFQIYCDFSGYSDIAIGVARLFGFKLMRNFAYPYFARDIAEHWRKWHISLSTWFKDYLYIPLGGSRGGKWMIIRNIIIIFTVSGFWHGANWTFVIWGFVNGLYFLPLILSGVHRNHMGPIAEGRFFPSVKDFALIALTFVLKTLTYVFFRAENIQQSWSYIKGMWSTSLFSLPDVYFFTPLPLLILFLTIEWWKRDKICPLYLDDSPKYLRRPLYMLVFCMIIIYTPNDLKEFIYFQF